MADRLPALGIYPGGVNHLYLTNVLDEAGAPAAAADWKLTVAVALKSSGAVVLAETEVPTTGSDGAFDLIIGPASIWVRDAGPWELTIRGYLRASADADPKRTWVVLGVEAEVSV